MKDVDYWVIEQTFKHLAELCKAIKHCEVCLFINISANSLTNSQFSEFVFSNIKNTTSRPIRSTWKCQKATP